MGIHGTLKHGDLTRGSYFLMGISMGYHQLGNPTWLPELEMGGFAANRGLCFLLFWQTSMIPKLCGNEPFLTG
jgi:hypothetical protein